MCVHLTGDLLKIKYLMANMKRKHQKYVGFKDLGLAYHWWS